MVYTEEQLKRMALPLGDTENEKCLHTIRLIWRMRFLSLTLEGISGIVRDLRLSMPGSMGK